MYVVIQHLLDSLTGLKKENSTVTICGMRGQKNSWLLESQSIQQPLSLRRHKLQEKMYQGCKTSPRPGSSRQSHVRSALEVRRHWGPLPKGNGGERVSPEMDTHSSSSPFIVFRLQAYWWVPMASKMGPPFSVYCPLCWPSVDTTAVFCQSAKHVSVPSRGYAIINSHKLFCNFGRKIIFLLPRF